MAATKEESFFSQHALEILKNQLLEVSSFPDQVTSLIKQQQHLYLVIELAENNISIYELCLNKALNDYWRELLANPELLRGKIRYAHSKIQFLPQANIPLFDLIMGIYYYYKFLVNKKTKEKKKEILPAHLFDDLLKSAKHGFFPAMDEINLNQTNRVKSVIENKSTDRLSDEFIKTMQSKAERAAKLHGTPGYLMLTYTLILLAKYNKHILVKA